MTEPLAGGPKLLCVVGNRPQFVKAAAVSHHFEGIATETLIHTGQHYDRELSDVFFEELGLAPPARNLAIGSGSHAQQTAAAISGLEPLFGEGPPDAVLVYGDTNTTLAAALVAAKLGVPVAHVEAGMRSFERSMPEEVNRVAVDHLSDLLLCSTETAVANLEAEGLGERAILVGDVMADVAARFGPLAERRSDILGRLGLSARGYLLATLHRAGNVDDAGALGQAVELLLAVADRLPVVFPVHPRTRSRLVDTELLGRLEESARIVLLEPQGYLDFSCLVRSAAAVLTDSGGLQKEAYLASVPCLTLRRETEWVESVESGWNRLVGVDREVAVEGLDEALARGPDRVPPDLGVYGDGDAGRRCALAVVGLAGASSAS